MHPLNYFAVYIWKTWQDYYFGKYLSKQCGTHYFWRYRRWTLQLYTAIFWLDVWIGRSVSRKLYTAQYHCVQSALVLRSIWKPIASPSKNRIRANSIQSRMDNQSTDRSRGNCWRSNIWGSSIISNASKAMLPCMHTRKTLVRVNLSHALNPQSCAVLVGSFLRT
jgi:hypothetical protein